MICRRQADVLLAAYSAGADDARVDAVAAALGLERIDVSAWRMQARPSIEVRRADWAQLQELRAWREQRSLDGRAMGDATAAAGLLSELG